jgi:predicted permease
MNLFLYQLMQAHLSLKQKPGFVFSVIATLGATLGALLCAITLNYLLLVEPLPYPEQDRLFVVDHGLNGAQNENNGHAFTYPGLVHLYKNKEAFEQAAMVSYGQEVIISHKSQPLVNTAYTTPELHQLLASPMALGRMFEASEAIYTNNPVAMLSYNTWQRDYNSNADILDQKITINGVSYRIVGVLAEHFVEPELAETQVWLPWDYNSTGDEQRQDFGDVSAHLKFIGQLKPNISTSRAQQLLTSLVNDRWQEEVREINFFKGWSIDMRVRSIKDVMLGQSESNVMMLLAGVFGLVLIACANISNLLMSRTAEKQRQMAIQAAIGATKKHLFKSIFAEIVLLMLMSIILALVFAQGGFYIMQQYLGAVLPRVSELSLNPITFGSAILVTIAFAFFFAELSAGMINYRALNTMLQSSGKGSGLQVSKKTRQILIASQVALATMLVFANFSLLKSAVDTINAPMGFTPKNISTLILNFSSKDFPSEEETIPVMAEMVEKLAGLPQVESVSQSSSPLDGFNIITLINVANNERFLPYFNEVDHTYFDMIEQPILQGGNFTIADRRDRTNVMIVNQAFAKQIKADGDVLGMQLSTGGSQPFKIIGIVKGIKIPGDIAMGSTIVDGGVARAYASNRLGGRTFMLKLKRDQSVNREQLVALLAKVDSRYSIFSFKAVSDRLNEHLFSKIITAITTTALALITFFIAGIGLYGVLSYSIQMRRLELGTRMAIGAKRYDLILLIIKDNAKPIIFGVLFSLVILLSVYLFFSAELSSYLTMQLVPMFVSTILLISTLSLLACYFPLRKYINKPAIHALKGSE